MSKPYFIFLCCLVNMIITITLSFAMIIELFLPLIETGLHFFQVIHEIGELLASYSSLSFSKERISWNPSKSSMGSEEPWRALYG